MRGRSREAAFLLLPGIGLLVVLFYLPQLLMLLVSLGRRTAYGEVERAASPDNYLRALEPLYLAILGRSLVLAAVTTVACLLVGYPVAWWLARRASPRWRNALLALVILPFWTSFLVRMYAWIVLLRSEGVINLALGAAGLPRAELLYNDLAVLIGQLYGELPFMIVPLYVSLEKLDPSLLEAAADLGADARRTFTRVVVPQTMPGIVAGCVLVFIPSLGAYLAPDLLGGGKTAYVGNLIQSQFAVARDMPFGAALSFVLSLVVVLLLLAFRRPLGSAQAL
ncbi:MAG TPA: ABC transporter permease [Vicinamibacteria bacterium]|nr:ABC transporter permease [Vicinamibacteria bacterium]